MFDDKPKKLKPHDLSQSKGSKKRSIKHENDVAKRLGGKKVQRSGDIRRNIGNLSLHQSSGDVSIDLVGEASFLVECKDTVHKSLSVKREWLEKLYREAKREGKVPLLAIRFEKVEQPCEQDWVCVPISVWEKLKKKEKEA